MRGLLLEKLIDEPNMIQVTATDGHILTTVKVEDERLYECLSNSHIIDDEAFKILKLMMKLKVMKFGIEINNGQGLVFNDGTNMFHVKFLDSEFHYPKFKHIIPNYDTKKSVEVIINGELLNRIIKSLETKKINTGIKLIVPLEGDEQLPVIVRSLKKETLVKDQMSLLMRLKEEVAS